MRFIFKIIILFLLGTLVHCGESQAQKVDSTKSEAPKKKYKDPRPRNAALLSLIIPGAGQIYNKKYWKAPIIWAALTADVIFLLNTRTNFRNYAQAYKDTTDGNTKTIVDSPYNKQSIEEIKYNKDYYERYYQLSYILGALGLGLNILDAYVDAHLKEFDVKEDLAIRIKPSIKMGYNNTVTTGISVTFKFK